MFLAPGAQDVEQIFIMCHSLATCHRQRLISEWVIRERRKSFSVKPGGNDVQCCAVAVAERVISNTALCSLYMAGLNAFWSNVEFRSTKGTIERPELFCFFVCLFFSILCFLLIEVIFT